MTDTIEQTVTRSPDLLDLLTLAGRPAVAPDGLVLGWRNTHPDLISRGDFQWSFPGQWTESPDDGRDLTTNHPTSACPSETLGGLCVAKTWAGARSGGITSAACLVLAYNPDDVLGEDGDKVRMRRALTICVVDTARLIRSANLDGANLDGANLDGANLDGANLDGASLNGANLDGANLDGANLDGANLDGASLNGANLDGANLDGANLDGANLYGANLNRASLNGANLDGANLYRARGDRYTQLPPGYVVNDAGLIVRTA